MTCPDVLPAARGLSHPDSRQDPAREAARRESEGFQTSGFHVLMSVLWGKRSFPRDPKCPVQVAPSSPRLCCAPSGLPLGHPVVLQSVGPRPSKLT